MQDANDFASLYRDIASNTATTMDMYTNAFCAAGMHLPNGSYATFGGNGAITKNGASVNASFDPLYGDYDGGLSIRVLDPAKRQEAVGGSIMLLSKPCRRNDGMQALKLSKMGRWCLLGDSLMVVM